MSLYKIKKSNIDKNGRGLYAIKNIKAGTKIIEYVGNIITKKKKLKILISLIIQNQFICLI